LVSKHFILSIVFSLSAFLSWTQEEKPSASEADSLKTDLKKEGIVVIDTLITSKKSLNPLAPAKAGFYSAVVPGLGQIYNKKYWKVPIVWGLIGGGIYGYISSNNDYNEIRTDFKRRKVGLPFLSPRIAPTATDQQLENLQNEFQSDRDLWLLATILMYALNVVDANVDAHLKQFNINENLSLNMEFQPYLNMNEITTDPHYGMALIVKF